MTLKTYLIHRKGFLLLITLLLLLQSLVLWLYELPLFARIYLLLIELVFLLLFAFFDYQKKRKTIKELEAISSAMKQGSLFQADFSSGALESIEQDPIGRGLVQILEELEVHLEKLQTKLVEEKKDLLDYYSLWIHQIKIPITSLTLLLESEDSSSARKGLQALRQIERYVSMVLVYLDLREENLDYVLEPVDLDEVLKEVLSGFSLDFIERKIALHYDPFYAQVLSDRKWLAFILEQILSNALKYTRKGSISLSFQDHTLSICDTGIGISSADLPRIFEKGFAGFNGRKEKNSSGLGLYLADQIARRLKIRLEARSKLRKGTQILLIFPRSLDPKD